jgi:transcription initiation factor TFIID TATA-box-binding protein
MELVQNVVSTFSLGDRVDLKMIASNGINVQYNPRKFSAAIMRLNPTSKNSPVVRRPKVTALIFGTGKVVCSGGKSLDENMKGARIIARLIQKLYLDQINPQNIRFINYTIHNIVGSFQVSFKIDLLAFNKSFPKHAFYDPTSFPGLRYKPYTTDKTTIIIFISGKIIITGVKDIHTLEEAKNFVSKKLIGFKRPFPYVTPFI